MNGQGRFHSIDSLRGAMIMVVMVGHCMLPYVTVPRSFKDPSTHVGFDVMAVFIYSFAMQVFFVTAGFAAALLLERRGVGGLVRNRVYRIFFPLLIAYLILSPLTRGAYDFAKAAVAAGSIGPAFDVFLAGEWLRWSKAYHLWFLVSLLIFSAIALGLRGLVRRLALGTRVLAGTRSLLKDAWRPLPVAVVIGFTTVPAYVVNAGEATTVFLQLSLLVFFVLGWLMYPARDLLPGLAGQARTCLLLAIAVLPVTVWATRQRLIAADETQWAIGLVAGIGNSLLGALMTFGLLGLFLGYGNRPMRIGRYLSDASYWCYLIHLPLVVAVGGALTVTSWPAMTKFAVTVAIVLPVVLGTYHYGVRLTSARR